MSMHPPSFHFTRLAGVALAMALVLIPAQGADTVRVGSYDFSYTSAGDASARPIQVFDDGKSTYMQFRAGMAVPAIFSMATGSPQLLVPTQEGPYVRIAEVYGSLLLQIGRARAQVVHAGGDRADAPALAVNTPTGRNPYVLGTPYPPGATLVASLTPVPMTINNAPVIVDDVVQRNSYAAPRKGDAVQWQEPAAAPRVERDVWFAAGSSALTPSARADVVSIGKSAPAGSRLVVIGREDQTYKDGLEKARARVIRDALTKSGISADRITEKLGVAGKQDGKLWSSTVVLEAESAAAAAPRTSNAVLENLQSLVRAGVLRPDQAEAIARNHGMALPGAASAQAAAATFGQPQAPDTRKAGAAAPAASKPWDMRKSDGTVEKMLARWAAEAGWTLVWKDGPSIPITGDAPLPSTDFLTAADTVISRAQEVGYRINAAAYSNQTLVIGQSK
jgi:hypothetical protein